jgi:flagellar biosynthetic protein FliQ
MSTDAIVRLLREGLLLMVLLSAAPLATAMLTGLVVSLLQATTRIQEATLSFVPKLIAVVATLVVLGPWMLNEALRFTRLMFDSIRLIR